MRRILLAASFAVAFVPAALALAQSPTEIVTGKCARCHSLVRVCNSLGGKDQAAWTTTVTRMIERNGAPLDAAEKATVIGYLSGLAKGTAPVCN